MGTPMPRVCLRATKSPPEALDDLDQVGVACFLDLGDDLGFSDLIGFQVILEIDEILELPDGRETRKNSNPLPLICRLNVGLVLI